MCRADLVTGEQPVTDDGKQMRATEGEEPPTEGGEPPAEGGASSSPGMVTMTLRKQQLPSEQPASTRLTEVQLRQRVKELELILEQRGGSKEPGILIGGTRVKEVGGGGGGDRL